MNLFGFSQSNIRLNNYWENTYYINPASIYSEYQFVASAAARKQWIGFPGAPETEYLTFAARVFTNKTQNNQVGQFGLKAYHDIIGYTEFINVSPSFSFSVKWDTKLLINFGAAYKIQSITYDKSKITLQSDDYLKPEIDPVVHELNGRWITHNADIGVEFVGNSRLAGVSVQNLMSLFNKDTTKLQTNSNFIYVMQRIEIDDYFNVLLGACAINNKNLFQGEFSVSGILKARKLPVMQLGVFYRTKKETGVLFGVDISSALRLAISYDYHIGDISHNSFGTPEVMLIWKFGRLRDCDCEELFK